MATAPSIAAHTAKLTLFVDNLRAQGSATLRAYGTSMFPAILPGDLITIDRTPMREVRAGDIVAFTRCDRLFVHRAVRSYQHSGSTWIVTRGDAMDREDAGPIREADFLGTVRITDTRKRRALLRLFLSHRLGLFLHSLVSKRNLKSSCTLPGKFVSPVEPIRGNP